MLTNKLLKGKVVGMPSTGPSDQAAAAAEAQARARLTRRLGARLPRGPWLAERQPVEDVTLLRAASWAATSEPESLELPEDVLAALALLASARREVDQLEAGLLFLARAEGVSWGLIGEALGLRTPQAAAQRSERVVARLEGRLE
jgi:hypothetical protein